MGEKLYPVRAFFELRAGPPLAEAALAKHPLGTSRHWLCRADDRPRTPRTWSDLDPYLKAAHLKNAIVLATVERIEF